MASKQTKAKMMIRSAHLAVELLVAGSILLALPTQVRAQFNPFHGTSNVPPLTREDYQMLNQTADKLNADAQARAGQVETWTNAASGASGSVTLAGVLQSGGMLCHALKYTIAVRKRSGSRAYNVTWCLTPSGEWKIKS